MVKRSNILRWKTSIKAADIMLDKITIFTSKKVKTNACNWPDRPTVIAPAILATKKAKTNKNVFDRKLLLRV